MQGASQGQPTPASAAMASGTVSWTMLFAWISRPIAAGVSACGTAAGRMANSAAGIMPPSRQAPQASATASGAVGASQHPAPNRPRPIAAGRSSRAGATPRWKSHPAARLPRPLASTAAAPA